MTTIASQITSLTVVYSTVYSDADQSKHQSSASLAFVWGIHRDRWIPRTKGQLRGKCFRLMTSSCFIPQNKNKTHADVWSRINLIIILLYISTAASQQVHNMVPCDNVILYLSCSLLYPPSNMSVVVIKYMHKYYMPIILHAFSVLLCFLLLCYGQFYIYPSGWILWRLCNHLIVPGVSNWIAWVD